MKKKALAFLTLASVSVLAGCSQGTTTTGSDAVVATVGDLTITQNDLYQDLKSAYGTVRLRSLILEKVLEANATDAKKLKEDAEAEVAKQQAEVGGEDAFKQLLAYQGLGTPEEFTKQLYVRNLLRAAIEKNIDMTDAAIEAFYNDGYEPSMEAQHILVDTEDEAKEVIERLANGEAFDDVAKEVSKDSTAKNGGLLNPFKKGQTVAEFEEVVRSLENGEVTQTPVKSRYGYHVIKVLNNGSKKPYETVKDEVKEAYVNAKFADSTTQNTILSNLIKAAKIDIKEADLKDAIKDLVDYKAPEVKESSSVEASSSTSEAVSDVASESERTEESESSQE